MVKKLFLCFVTLSTIITLSGCGNDNSKNLKYMESDEQEFMRQIQEGPIEEKIEYCKDLESTALFMGTTKATPQKIFDACLFMLLTGSIEDYDDRLCEPMYGEVRDTIQNPVDGSIMDITYKNSCYSDIAIKKNDISYCNGQGILCLSNSVITILKQYGDINCESLLQKSEKEICNNIKFNTKYGIIFSLKELSIVNDDNIKNEIEKNNILFFNKFGSIENLCDNMAKDAIKINGKYDVSQEKLYNNCIYQYMENRGEANVEHCKKLKYQEVPNKYGMTVTDKDYCFAGMIIQDTKNIKDCQFADNIPMCIGVIAKQMGESSECDKLSDTTNKNICYKISGKENIYFDNIINKSNCIIKGNISYYGGEKIYHIPGCASYNATVINADYGERRFCSEQEAVNAGWRKAYNCP